MKIAIVSLLVLLAAASLNAQAPGVSLPLSLEIGIGGGVSQPLGVLADAENTGWHAGAKARLSGPLPFNIVASALYNRLPNKKDGESATAWMAGAGLEFAVPGPIVKPYLGGDLLVNSISSTVANAPSVTREGIGLGGGVTVGLPFLGSVDASVKYQIFNLLGKEGNEENVSQVQGTVMLIFSVL